MQQQIDQAHEVTKGWTKQDHLDAQQRWEDFEVRVVAALQDGCAVDDPRVVALLDEHVAMLRRSRAVEPDAVTYARLGEMYADHPDFRARYDAKDPRLAEFLRDAMASYGAARLA